MQLEVELLLLLSTYGIISEEDCTAYNIKEDFYERFTNNKGICTNNAMWEVKHYNETDISPPDLRSESFISPNEILSCVASFDIEMEQNGVLEVKVYLQQEYFAQIYVVDSSDQVLVIQNLAALDEGWNDIRLGIPMDFTGYVAFMGQVSPGGEVLIDSFRYISPNFIENELDDLCDVYEYNEEEIDEGNNSTTESNTENTLDSSTDSSGVSGTTQQSEFTTEASTIQQSEFTTEESSTQQSEFTTEANTTQQSESTTEASTSQQSEFTTEANFNSSIDNESNDIESTTEQAIDVITIVENTKLPLWVIILIAVLCFIILILICWLSYELNRKIAAKDEISYEHFDETPEQIIPRVTKLYNTTPPFNKK